MLFRADLLETKMGASRSRVAILRSASNPETLLRVAVYPQDELVYCGLWLDGDMFLGWTESPAQLEGDLTFSACVVPVSGATDLTIKLLASWVRRSPNSSHHDPRSADAVVVSSDGQTIDRLRMVDQHTEIEPAADGSRNHLRLQPLPASA